MKDVLDVIEFLQVMDQIFAAGKQDVTVPFHEIHPPPPAPVWRELDDGDGGTVVVRSFGSKRPDDVFDHPAMDDQLQ